MYPHQTGPGQLPSHWNPQPTSAQQPANGAYPPPPSHINTSLPPPSPAEPRPDMAALHPQHPPGYRLPPPHEWSRAPPADPYRQAPAPSYMNHGHQPPAPRQRTAIACRYCRRRKIRCSGFEATEDGRCSNCMRFNQDCIFTPVSAQTQAFVPAHTVWRGVGQPPPMYGAYGQPLQQPATQAPEPYQAPRQQTQYMPNVTGPYSSTLAPAGGAPYDAEKRDAVISRKRPHPEPHPATLPPPAPASTSHVLHLPRSDYTYPDPSSLTKSAVSPASSTNSYPPPQPPSQPYYPTPTPRRASPQSNYSYSDAGRASSSPHTQGPPSTPGIAPPYYAATPVDSNALRPLPLRTEGRTPPPASQPSSRPSMRITDLMSDSGNGRSSADDHMLDRLNRGRPM